MYLGNVSNSTAYDRYNDYYGYGSDRLTGSTSDDGTVKFKTKDEEKEAYETGEKECQTCKNRKYQDGSNEMVSFKSAAHISPESAGSVVRAHEQEHVSNAYNKASTGGGEVVSTSVSIHTAICPECGRSYVSGGTTNTQIKYVNEDNKYQQELKSQDKGRLTGMFFDEAV